VTRELELLLPTVLTANADRHRLPPPGLFGGGDGTVNRFSIIRDGQDRTFSELFGTPSPSKFTNVQVQVGDILAVTQGGGAAYGDPLERDPELVARDVKDGYISAERAHAAYGVVIDAPVSWADPSATRELRTERHEELQP
jgi:N-methylhydantoinase B/oxoprolinase/acetone carboxylase alpha subunit